MFHFRPLTQQEIEARREAARLRHAQKQQQAPATDTCSSRSTENVDSVNEKISELKIEEIAPKEDLNEQV